MLKLYPCILKYDAINGFTSVTSCSFECTTTHPPILHSFYYITPSLASSYLSFSPFNYHLSYSRLLIPLSLPPPPPFLTLRSLLTFSSLSPSPLHHFPPSVVYTLHPPSLPHLSPPPFHSLSFITHLSTSHFYSIAPTSPPFCY